MYIHVDDKMATEVQVFNLDTGEFLNRCRWANDKTGEYLEFIKFDNGAKYKLKKANIKLIYKPTKE